MQIFPTPVFSVSVEVFKAYHQNFFSAGWAQKCWKSYDDMCMRLVQVP